MEKEGKKEERKKDDRNAKKPRCQNAKMPKCQNVKMHTPIAAISKCQNDQIAIPFIRVDTLNQCITQSMRYTSPNHLFRHGGIGPPVIFMLTRRFSSTDRAAVDNGRVFGLGSRRTPLEEDDVTPMRSHLPASDLRSSFFAAEDFPELPKFLDAPAAFPDEPAFSNASWITYTPQPTPLPHRNRPWVLLIQ